MHISLKQARRIEREIGTQIEQKSMFRGNGRMVVSIYEDMNEKVGQVQTQVLGSIAAVKQLTTIRFSLRKAIETANEHKGLNSLMNREAELKTLQKAYVGFNAVELTDSDFEVNVKRFEALKQQNTAGVVVQNQYDTSDTVTLNATVRTATQVMLRDEAKLVQRELLAVVDKLSGLNASVHVEVADEDVKTLELAGIIV